jgi:sn-glycerol 3-phosphate transport system substrate-binding protein
MKKLSLKWKSVLSMTCALAMIFSLTACSQSSGGSSEAKSKSTEYAKDVTSGSEIDLTLWHSMGGTNGTALNQIVNDFNSKNSGVIKITAQYQGKYDDAINKLKTAETAGSGPNLMQIYELGLRFMIDSGWVIPVQDAIDGSGWDIKQIEPNLAAYYTVNKKLYGMPFNSSTPILYYNKDAFKKAGLDVNTPPQTFAKVIEYAKKIKTATGMEGFGMWDYGWWFDQTFDNLKTPMFDQGNGRTANPKKVIGQTTLKKWMTTYKSLYTEGASPSYAVASDDVDSAFMSGKLAMCIDSTCRLTSYLKGINGKFELGCGYYPTTNSTEQIGVSIGGACFYMFKNNDSRARVAEWMFIKYAATPSVQAFWNAASGYFPVNVNAKNEQAFKDNVAKYPQFQVAIDQLHKSSSANCGFLCTIGTQVRKIEETDMGKVLNNQMTIDAAVSDITSQVNSALEDYNAANS